MYGLGSRLLRTLPKVDVAFGYGSGVMKQGTESISKEDNRPQVDFLLAVEDPLEWHAEMVKYGVTSLSTLIDDLRTWRYLYLSGRLHKPVLWFTKPSSIDADLNNNIQSALAAALLLSPSIITRKDIFRKICGLSYAGDVRMGVAEDRSKIEKIVEGSYAELDRLYAPLIEVVHSGFEFQTCID